MIPDNVTLIVKAPNQQIEDQNVECQSSWTVRQLKGHLSEVYPSKPRSEEQKIIYSGQLLDDNTILKDVLRTYESQIAHTMHLVCTPKRMSEPQPPTPSTDGLRQRTSTNNTSANMTTPVTEPITRPETRQNDVNHSVELQNYLSWAQQGDAAARLQAAHHAYLQYMHQYAHMWQAAGAAPPPAAAPPAPAPPPPAPDDDEHAHDWLDQLYAASRLAILFSLVYLYGSAARLLLVLLLAAAGYLHQIGFFRDLHVNPANLAPRRNAQPDLNRNQPNINQPDINQPNINQPDNQANINQPENGTQPNDQSEPRTQEDTTNQPRNNDNQQSLLAVTWMIFTSFFASLIPEAN